jgi:alpha,alpha-trehalase
LTVAARRRSLGGVPVGALDPSRFDAVLFDLDGVITRTASVHAAAWRETFDAYLAVRGARERRRFAPFDPVHDYRRWVDGKPRYDGVASLLGARGIALPWGRPTDPPDRETVCGLGNRKQERYAARLAAGGVEVFPATVELIRRLRARGTRIAVVSASKSCREVLRVAGLEALFDARVDGIDIEQGGIPGKPRPDTFLEAARRLDVAPARAVVVEDALAGVEAGRRGGFGLVIGVDHAGQEAEMRARGADLVVRSLAEVPLAA